MDKLICDSCSVNQITQFASCLLFINGYIFRHLRLEIASAIPASNDEKSVWGGRGLVPGRDRASFTMTGRLLAGPNKTMKIDE